MLTDLEIIQEDGPDVGDVPHDAELVIIWAYSLQRGQGDSGFIYIFVHQPEKGLLNLAPSRLFRNKLDLVCAPYIMQPSSTSPPQ